jgi:hypothetical protein
MPPKGKPMTEQQKAKLSTKALAKPIKSEKFCPRCKTVKARSEYGLRKTDYGRQLKSYCRPCERAYAVETTNRHIAAHPEKKEIRKAWNRKATLKRHYGITVEQYERLFVNQEGKCAICGSDEAGRDGHKNLVVDHCHQTDRIRGLLCHKCNRALGFFGDNKQSLLKAIDYLDSPPAYGFGLQAKKRKSGVEPIQLQKQEPIAA